MATTTYLVALCGFYTFFYISRIIYRLLFHPLARYPGRKLAIAFPTWSKLYRNFRKRGQLVFDFEELHRLHGPVIRFAVNDLHVNDPEVYLEITKIGSGFRKDPKFYDRISFRNASLGILDPYLHRARRTVLVNAAFSPHRVRELSWIVEDRVHKLLRRFEASSQNDQPVNIHKGCKALAMDIISQATMGQDFGCLDHPQYRNIFLEKLHAIFEEMSWMGKILFTAAKVSLSTPPWMFRFVHPPTMIMMKELAKPMVENHLSRMGSSSDTIEPPSGTAIIDKLIDPKMIKNGPPLDLETLCQEVVTLLTAGGDTVSSALILGIYTVCRNMECYKRLETELLSTFPEKQRISHEEAKNLPYLNACIKEVLRISNPLPGRLPRVVPSEGFQLYDHHLPHGTVINTSAYLLNRHTSIWSDPDSFKPERWLEPELKNLEKYMASFYRGTRQCVGQDFAWCELVVMLANLFRQFEVDICGTSDSDMEWVDAVLIVFKGKNFHATLKKRQW